MVVVEPDVKLVFRQVGGVFRKDPSVVVIGVSQEDPANMGPPCAVMGGMRVAGLIRLLMVQAMGRNPEDRTTFEC